MKKKFPLLAVLILFIFNSCDDDNDDPVVIDDYDLDVIQYFKDVALGFEFGNATEITRKWVTPMRIYVGGEVSAELQTELTSIINEINALATDGFEVQQVSDTLQSNFYIFFGSGDDYAEIFPGQANLVNSNWGLFSVFWQGNNSLFTGYMYVDIYRAQPTAQKHLLREELTQALGLAKDSPQYPESIFQQSWTTTTSYAQMDKDLIRLLYHPEMVSGLTDTQVDALLRNILGRE